MSNNDNNGLAWSEQFKASLDNCAAIYNMGTCAQGDLSLSVENTIQRYSMDTGNARPVVDALIATALRARLNQEAWNVQVQMKDALRACESPIEKAMCLALLIAGHGMSFDTALFYKGTIADWRNGPHCLFIGSQIEIGDHRVDFLLAYRLTGNGRGYSIAVRENQPEPPALTVTKFLIIECDGHDFHDRTKEQASKDRSRDRDLQALGYHVYRFTGADIWADVFKCASESISYVKRAAYLALVEETSAEDNG